MTHKKKRLTLGQATTRKVSQREANLIRESSAQQGRPGGQSAKESREIERRREPREERRKKQRRTVLPTITAKAPIKAERPEQKTGILSKLLANVNKNIQKTKLALDEDTTSIRLDDINSVEGRERIFDGLQKAAIFAPGFSIAAKTLTLSKTGALIGKVATNPKTIASSISMISKIAIQLKKPAYVVAAIGAMIGTYPWAEWAQTEAGEILGFSSRSAINTGDPETIRQFQEIQAEIVDKNIWEQIARLIPGANIVTAFRNKMNAIRAQAIVNNKLMADAIIQLETGESEDAKWSRVREEQAEQEKANIDYYNEQRKQMVEWEREAERDARNKDAAFWRKEKENQRRLEEKDRKAIADFWIAYRKEALKIANDNRPSNLNFGLL
ncbi:MAG: hypothetical protein KJI72_04250 [Patescibacteria group bacterium]|nr:hypothetical protein [Patescibacteria group bacterium]MCP6727542.1 hypothetical protein [Patescibacteria group bacterium]